MRSLLVMLAGKCRDGPEVLPGLKTPRLVGLRERRPWHAVEDGAAGYYFNGDGTRSFSWQESSRREGRLHGRIQAKACVISLLSAWFRPLATRDHV